MGLLLKAIGPNKKESMKYKYKEQKKLLGSSKIKIK